MLHWLDSDQLWFPAPHKAGKDGLLAAGGDLAPDRLLLAYRSGIFPWFNDDEPPLWWCPDPRAVLFPAALKISKSMQQLLRRNAFIFRTNTAFGTVIDACRTAARNGNPGTWITDDIVTAFTSLHRLGYAHCAETWQGDRLVGGLYGIRIGNMFFGESMFSHVSNASKYAFICYVRQLAAEGIPLIDCQIMNDHLQSLGATEIPRTEFLKILHEAIPH